jgi:hypothetical protein
MFVSTGETALPSVYDGAAGAATGLILPMTQKKPGNVPPPEFPCSDLRSFAARWFFSPAA